MKITKSELRKLISEQVEKIQTTEEATNFIEHSINKNNEMNLNESSSDIVGVYNDFKKALFDKNWF